MPIWQRAKYLYYSRNLTNWWETQEEWIQLFIDKDGLLLRVPNPIQSSVPCEIGADIYKTTHGIMKGKNTQ